MKKIIPCILLILSLASPCHAGPEIFMGAGVTAVDNPTLFSEDFEGAGPCYTGDETYNNCRNVWTVAGTPNFKGSGITGTYATTQTSSGSIRSTWTDQAHVYAKLTINFTYFTSATTSAWAAIKDSGSVTNRCHIKADSTSHLVITDGAAVSDTGSILSTGTLYYFWFEYDGSGGDGAAVCRVYYNTTDSRPETPDVEFTNGANAGTVGMIAVVDVDSNVEHTVDDIIVKSTGW